MVSHRLICIKRIFVTGCFTINYILAEVLACGLAGSSFRRFTCGLRLNYNLFVRPVFRLFFSTTLATFFFFFINSTIRTRNNANCVFLLILKFPRKKTKGFFLGKEKTKVFLITFRLLKSKRKLTFFCNKAARILMNENTFWGV